MYLPMIMLVCDGVHGDAVAGLSPSRSSSASCYDYGFSPLPGAERHKKQYKGLCQFKSQCYFSHPLLLFK